MTNVNNMILLQCKYFLLLDKACNLYKALELKKSFENDTQENEFIVILQRELLAIFKVSTYTQLKSMRDNEPLKQVTALVDPTISVEDEINRINKILE